MLDSPKDGFSVGYSLVFWMNVLRLFWPSNVLTQFWLLFSLLHHGILNGLAYTLAFWMVLLTPWHSEWPCLHLDILDGLVYTLAFWMVLLRPWHSGWSQWAVVWRQLPWTIFPSQSRTWPWPGWCPRASLRSPLWFCQDLPGACSFCPLDRSR